MGNGGLTTSDRKTRAVENKSIRWFVFFTFLILVGLTIFVLIFFKEKPEILHPILTGLGGLIAGGLGGYGFAKKSS